ncbi:MAG: tandem-95 repeat protein, partial [Puniceicoccaceae bacterium]
AASVIVNLHIFVRDTHRVISALTNAQGQFSVAWTPLPGEAGLYSVGAAHPGRPTAPPEDTFTLFGMGTDPREVGLLLNEGAAPKTGAVHIRNRANVPLTALQVEVLDVPAGVELSAGLADGEAAELPGLGETDLWFEASAPTALVSGGTARVRISSAEGAVLEVPFELEVRALRSRLVAEPAGIVAGLVRGGQRVVSFDLTNEGGGPSGPVRVVLPAVPWMHAGTPELPTLEPGQAVPVNLVLNPPEDLALGIHSGALVLRAGDSSLNVPFEFRVLTEGVGDLRVETVNELTYYAEGAPRLAGALVRVIDAVDGETVAEAETDADGIAFFSGLPEGYYHLNATADNHARHRATVFVAAGGTLEHSAFLSWQTVRYTWTVVPTEIEDRTRIVVESVFETNVPIPVITVTPSRIDVAEFTSEINQVDITITNHGLLAANDLRIRFGTHPFWSIEPLVEELGTLPALSSLRIPVIFRRIGGSEPQAGLAGGATIQSGAACGVGGAVSWELICGPHRNGYSAGIAVANAGGGGCSGGWAPWGSGGGGYWAPVGTTTQGNCDPCLAKAVLSCLIGYTPLGCPFGLLTADTIDDKIIATVGCIAEVLGFSTFGAVLNTITCIQGIAECMAGGPGGGPGGGGPPVSAGLAGGITIRPANSGVTGAALEEAIRRFETIVAIYENLFGEPDWIGPHSGDRFLAWMTLFHEFVDPEGEDGASISEAERAFLLSAELPEGIDAAAANRFIDRWNRSLAYYAAGIFTASEVPEGESTDFIDQSIFDEALDQMAAAYAASAADGFADPLEQVLAAKDTWFRSIDNAGICARVKIQLDQEAVLTRDAFEAALEIVNDSTVPMEDILVSITITDTDGKEATSLFGIRPPELREITAVDGQGLLAMETTGRAAWTLVPTGDAAPEEPVEYWVGGTLHYRQAGLLVTIPLAPAIITVHPSPVLRLRYFHERDVFANDPWTDEIEPSIPFSLAVMVENAGQGTARNLRIDSAQPEIVENEKGLFIDFQIIATEVAGQPLSPGLTVKFGDIAPGETAIGRWLMTSTLQGLFISYDATFEHLDGFGDPRLSLIESVSIHELIRVVRAPGPFEDGLPDFLVNDFPDAQALPDTLYLSDGSIAPVAVASGLSFDGAPSAEDPVIGLTAAAPAGWVFFRAPDPGEGDFRLVRVVRSDGSDLPVDNFWQTDRTFLGLGQQPLREDRIHFLDYDSTGAYTLHFEALPGPDLEPPASSVDALPAESLDRFIVTWDGSDDGSGIAHFDIFVSQDDAPFTPWLTATKKREALFEGEVGSNYAFYSVATDAAGNREATPTAAQAQTIITGTNQPPVLAPISDRTIDERQTLSFTIAASDPNPGDILSFRLEPGAPAGATLDPVTGRFRWPTGEIHGGSVYTIGVRVSDSGLPPLSAVAHFEITVNEVNHPPVLDPLPDRLIVLGQTLAFTARATDSDLPKNTLAFSLGTDAPAGAAIDPATGAFNWTPQAATGPIPVTVVVTDDGEPPLSASRTFLVTVNAENTPPVISLNPNPLTYTEGDGEVRIDPAANVVDPDSPDFGGGELTVAIASGAAAGDRLGIAPGGGVSLQGADILVGGAAIGMAPGALVEGTSLLVVLNENATPAAVRSLLRRISFTNTDRFPSAGPRLVRFQVSDGDGGVSEPAFRTIEVVPVNAAPVAGADFLGAERDQVLHFPEARLLRNDFDPDGDPIELSLPATGTHQGGAIARAGGQLSYTPPAGFSGRDTFFYRLADPYGGESDGRVTIIVRDPEDPEVTLVDLGFEDTQTARPILIGLPGRDYAAWWSVNLRDWLAVGLVTADATGEIDFLHAVGADLPRRFYQFAFPGEAGIAARPDALATTAGLPMSFPSAFLLENDTHPEGAGLVASLSTFQTLQHGSLGLAGDVITYTPPAGFIGYDGFNYTASDAAGAMASASVSILVLGEGETLARYLLTTIGGDGIPRSSALGHPGRTYRIFASGNLQQWTLIGEATADAAGRLRFEDTRADLPDRQFYRAVLLE